MEHLLLEEAGRVSQVVTAAFHSKINARRKFTIPFSV